jgi:hypothetical protein
MVAPARSMKDILPDDAHGLFRGSDPQSSREAARVIVPRLNEIQAHVLSAVRDAGPAGLTDFELDAKFNCKKSTYRTRRAELVEKALIRDSGMRRENDDTKRTVWVAV